MWSRNSWAWTECWWKVSCPVAWNTITSRNTTGFRVHCSEARVVTVDDVCHDSTTSTVSVLQDSPAPSVRPVRHCVLCHVYVVYCNSQDSPADTAKHVRCTLLTAVVCVYAQTYSVQNIARITTSWFYHATASGDFAHICCSENCMTSFMQFEVS